MRIPVTLLTGYLGAGKTTVINHLLGARAAPRFTVLVNDFGALNIDARLIADRGGDTITLSNGCACCSMGEDLSEALAAQLTAPSRPERLIIEASGVAEPRRIAKTVEAWPDLLLDAIVTVADAGTVETRTADKFVGNLVRRQLQAADILLLNKADLLDEEARTKLAAWLGAQAPAALRLAVTRGAVAPAVLFGPAQMDRALAHQAQVPDPLPQFHTRTFQTSDVIDLELLARLLAQVPAALHRVKGFVRDRAGVVHLVQHVGRQAPSIERYSRLGPPPPLGLVAIATESAAIEAFAADLAALDLAPRGARTTITGSPA